MTMKQQVQLKEHLTLTDWLRATLTVNAIIAMVLTWFAWAIILLNNFSWNWRIIGGVFLILSLIGTIVVSFVFIIKNSNIAEENERRKERARQN